MEEEEGQEYQSRKQRYWNTSADILIVGWLIDSLIH